MRKFLSWQVVLLFACLFAPWISASPDFAGTGTGACADCHQSQHQSWLDSHHAKAMLLPNETSVEGNFENQTFKHKEVTSRFYRRDKQFLIDIQEPGKKAQTYPVAYTFGFYPLQQYLIKTEKGHYQAYDVAWDARSKEQGGQRWFKLLPDEDTGPDSPFNWSKQLNNWNSRCADCHSTGLKKNFDEETLSFDTTWKDINVACESCHGEGSEHVKLAKTGKLSEASAHSNRGFAVSLKAAIPFHWSDGAAIARAPDLSAAKAVQQSQINACGGCHSRRQPIAESGTAQDYHDRYRLSLLQEPLYKANGDIQDEVFVLGSFLQSKMYQAGVTCTHCHEAHSGEVKLQGNAVCSQCHQPAVFDTKAHHKKTPGTEDSECVDCHMPETVYMGVDARRDHRFSIPGQNNETDRYTALNDQARMANPRALRDISEYVLSQSMPEIRRATLLGLSGHVPSRLTLETIVQSLKSDSALVRSAAADSSRFLPLDVRWQVLEPLINDPSASVRFSVAELLAPVYSQLQAADAISLSGLLDEHREQLDLVADAPSGQAAIASFELALGNVEAAIAALKTALEIEQTYLPAWLNLADIYRRTGDKEAEKSCLETALALDENNSAVQHAYGLYLVRQQKPEAALPHLRRATEVEPTEMQFFYVYAVALESLGEVSEAIKQLKTTDDRWPNQYTILMALVQYLEKAGRDEESWSYLSKLSAIAPDDPAVKQRVNRLNSGNTPQ